MPEDTNQQPDVPEMSFVLEGFDTLSQNLNAGGSATTAAKQLDKDLQKYESRATDYCKKIMNEAAAGLPAGSRPVLAPPDPLTFWNIQVCHLLELSLPYYMACSLG